MPIHPIPRCDKRRDKICELLREKNIDVFMTSDPLKITYVNMTTHHPYYQGTSVFLWAKTDPTLLARAAEKGRLMYENFLIKDVQYWAAPSYVLGQKPVSFAEKCVEILREHGVEKGVIAVEESIINWVTYSTLRKEFPKATFVNGEELIHDLMRVKDDEEIALIQRATDMTDAGLEAVIEAARVGITEAQLAGVAEKAMREMNCEDFFSPTQVNFDNRVFADHIPTERILRRGDMIGIDLHPTWKGYHGDYYRTLFLGKPTREYEKIAQVCTEATHEVLKSMVPGAKASEIALTYDDRIKRAGYTILAPTGIGHGLSTGYVPTFIVEGSDLKFLENEVLPMHPGIFEPGKYTYTQEFQARVTKDGGIPLNKSRPLGLIVIDR